MDKSNGYSCIIIDPVDEYLITGLTNIGINVDFKPSISKHDLVQIIGNYDMLLGRVRLSIDKSLIHKGKKLKMVIRTATGIENIDVEELNKNDIILVSAPGASVESVAELSVCLMIMAARNVYNDVYSLKNGAFKREMGMELKGKTLGIIGFGRIGIKLAELLKPFGMHIVANDVFDLSDTANAMGVEFLELSELLSQSDIISVNASTKGNSKPILDHNAFMLMKRGVIILNTARANTVDMYELQRQISNSKVGFYATDVLWNEPPTDEIELRLIHDNRFLATSHIGAQTYEAQKNVAKAIMEGIINALKMLDNK